MASNKLKGSTNFKLTLCLNKKRYDPYSLGGFPYTSLNNWHKSYDYKLSPYYTEDEYVELRQKMVNDLLSFIDIEIELQKALKNR